MARVLIAMICVALCSALLGTAAAINQETGIGRKLLRAEASRSLTATSVPGPCGGGRQPVCKGAQLTGRQFECNFGFSNLGGTCVPYKEVQQATAAPPPPPPPAPAAPAPPAPVPALKTTGLQDSIGLESGGCADPIVQRLIALDNEARAAMGSPPLACDEAVCKLALEHSKSQCLRRSMDHDMLTMAEGPGSRGAKMSAMGLKSRAENAFWNESPLNEQATKSHEGLMNSCYHRNNLEDPAFTVVGYGYYVCANGPAMREQVDGSVTSYNPPIPFPVMYHTATFGGPQRTVAAKTTCE